MCEEFLGLNLRINLPSKDWEPDRKLIFGSLCVISVDDFAETLFLGVVVQNDLEKNIELAQECKYIEF